MEGRGTYKKAGKFCPTLEAKSNIECVVGLDQLDCLRRINKGAAHFGVFSAEDLKAAQWAGIDVLITSELRFNNGEIIIFLLLFRIRFDRIFALLYLQQLHLSMNWLRLSQMMPVYIQCKICVEVDFVILVMD